MYNGSPFQALGAADNTNPICVCGHADYDHSPLLPFDCYLCDDCEGFCND